MPGEPVGRAGEQHRHCRAGLDLQQRARARRPSYRHRRGERRQRDVDVSRRGRRASGCSSRGGRRRTRRRRSPGTSPLMPSGRRRRVTATCEAVAPGREHAARRDRLAGGVADRALQRARAAAGGTSTVPGAVTVRRATSVALARGHDVVPGGQPGNGAAVRRRCAAKAPSSTTAPVATAPVWSCDGTGGRPGCERSAAAGRDAPAARAPDRVGPRCATTAKQAPVRAGHRRVDVLAVAHQRDRGAVVAVPLTRGGRRVEVTSASPPRDVDPWRATVSSGPARPRSRPAGRSVKRKLDASLECRGVRRARRRSCRRGRARSASRSARA